MIHCSIESNIFGTYSTTISTLVTKPEKWKLSKSLITWIIYNLGYKGMQLI